MALVTLVSFIRECCLVLIKLPTALSMLILLAGLHLLFSFKATKPCYIHCLFLLEESWLVRSYSEPLRGFKEFRLQNLSGTECTKCAWLGVGKEWVCSFNLDIKPSGLVWVNRWWPLKGCAKWSPRFLWYWRRWLYISGTLLQWVSVLTSDVIYQWEKNVWHWSHRLSAGRFIQPTTLIAI